MHEGIRGNGSAFSGVKTGHEDMKSVFAVGFEIWIGTLDYRQNRW